VFSFHSARRSSVSRSDWNTPEENETLAEKVEAV